VTKMDIASVMRMLRIESALDTTGCAL
jgi:hypothetical protein